MNFFCNYKYLWLSCTYNGLGNAYVKYSMTSQWPVGTQRKHGDNQWFGHTWTQVTSGIRETTDTGIYHRLVPNTHQAQLKPTTWVPHTWTKATPSMRITNEVHLMVFSCFWSNKTENIAVVRIFSW